MASEKEEIILDIKVEQGDAISELEQTKIAIINLKKEQKDLNESYKKGKVSTEDYAKASVKLEGELKKNNKAYNDNLKAVNNVKTKFDELVDGLTGSIPGFGGVSKGFSGITAGAKAFIATPIGAILAALSVVIGVLTAAFKKSEPVLDFFEDIITKITAAVDVFLVNIDKVGKIIGNVLTLNFSEAAVAMGELTQAFKEGVTQAQLYLDITRQLEDSSFKLRLETAETENQIKALVVASKNRNLTFEESSKLLEQARELEGKLTQARTDQARAEEVNGIKQIALKKGLKQLDEETFDQFVDRIIENRKIRGQDLELSKEEKDAVLALVEARAQAASQTLAFQEKIQNQLDAAAEKDEARREKELEQKIKNDEIQSEIDRARRIRELEETREHNDALSEAERLLQENLNRIRNEGASTSMQQTNALLKAKIDADKKDSDNKRKKSEEEQKIDYLVTQAKIQNAINVLNVGSQLLKEGSVAAKAAAIAVTTAQTISAATAALAPPPVGLGPVLGPILAALTTAVGLANVAKIAGLSFAAGGGSFMTKGPTAIVVGDNPGGVEHVQVTPISGRGKTVVGNGLIRMAGGGSVVANASSSRIDQSMSSANMMKNLDLKVSWVEGKELGDKIKFKEELVTA